MFVGWYDSDGNYTAINLEKITSVIMNNGLGLTVHLGADVVLIQDKLVIQSVFKWMNKGGK